MAPRALPELTVANAQFVTDRVAVGGDLAPAFTVARAQLEDLARAGITHIADLRDEWSDADLVELWQPELKYLHHPVRDAGQRIPASWFETLHSWASAALADPDAKLLVHCHMGVNRGPSAAFALLLGQGRSVREALTAIRGHRPVAVIDYADDALTWHLERTGADRYARAGARRSLTLWRKANQIDKLGVIRQIRAAEGVGSSWGLSLGHDTITELATLLENSPQPTVGFAVEYEPEQLALRDEVVFWDAATGAVGFGWVAGPPREQDGRLLLPVMLLGFNPNGLVPTEVLELVAPGFEFGGRNPVLLSEPQVLALNAGLQVMAQLASQPQYQG